MWVYRMHYTELLLTPDPGLRLIASRALAGAWIRFIVYLFNTDQLHFSFSVGIGGGGIVSGLTPLEFIRLTLLEGELCLGHHCRDCPWKTTCEMVTSIECNVELLGYWGSPSRRIIQQWEMECRATRELLNRVISRQSNNFPQLEMVLYVFFFVLLWQGRVSG